MKIKPSVDALRGKAGDGVDLGAGQADARGSEVLVKMLGARGAGDRERRGGAVQLPGQRDLLRRDVVFRSDRVDHRVERLALGAAERPRLARLPIHYPNPREFPVNAGKPC
jgi:hypothetical protein